MEMRVVEEGRVVSGREVSGQLPMKAKLLDVPVEGAGHVFKRVSEEGEKGGRELDDWVLEVGREAGMLGEKVAWRR